ncbi:competence protein ComEA helix-hairpin-helix repeat region [Anaerolinea thermolimosa]|uniref:helix-hairpin-helix domain-containing protein n=1 Tax=Anaerolinea thermolimosa TaxID=229919 RepID=UPI00078268BB|nr:helix-hairpin-helix domain-containing protein [Anaerolinea thermolimosa]GAP06485.1 competence protein ComEA helix-hairpin-helix repeat region [Anaerolinea thermolimosa]
MTAWPDWCKVTFGIFVGLLAGAVIFWIARQPDGTPITLMPRPTPSPFQVFVTGAVANPGVYGIEPGGRVIAALQKAGGETFDADLSQVNLAALVNDGEKIYIPRKGEPLPVEYKSKSSTSTSNRVDLNKASLEELMQLPGIGQDRAQAIIAYRQSHGGFTSIEEITLVEGIGQGTLERLKDLIIINQP